MLIKKLRLLMTISLLSMLLAAPAAVYPCAASAQEIQTDEDAGSGENVPEPSEEMQEGTGDGQEETVEETVEETEEIKEEGLGEAGAEESSPEEASGTQRSALQESASEYVSQTITAVDECKSGIIEVAVGYEFDDASFDPWLTGAGFLVSDDKAITLSRFISIKEGSEVYRKVAEARKNGYLALGIDMSNYANIESHLALYVYTADGSRIRAQAKDLDGTAALLSLSKSILGVRTFTLATDGTFQKGFRSGFSAGFKQKFLDNAVPASIKNVFIEEAAIHSVDGGKITFSTTADNGIAGGPLVGTDMIVYGVCLGDASSGTGSAEDIRSLQPVLQDESVTYDIVQKERGSITDLRYSYVFIIIIALALFVCVAVGILLLLSSRKTSPSGKKKAKKKRTEEEKDGNAPDEDGKEDPFEDSVPDQTEKYDIAYAEQRDRERRIRKAAEEKERDEARKRRSREILDDEDGEGDTGVLSKKRYPYFIRKSTGERIDISKSPYIIGKSPSGADYCIKGNGTISKKHCEIVIRLAGGEKRYYVHDLGSTNDTYVNGTIVNGDTQKYLQDGDTLTLSNEEFAFHTT